MWNLNEVTHIEYQSGYRYLVEFDDGVRAVLDLSTICGGGQFRTAARHAVLPVRHDRRRHHRWPTAPTSQPETLYEKCEQAGACDALQRA